MDLRCGQGVKFAELDLEGGVIKVKCRHPQCGAERGVVIIHDFDLRSGNPLATHKYKDPAIRKGG